jgi:hypothetical protein
MPKDTKWPEMPAPKCSKCGGDMKEGFVPEVSPNGSKIEAPLWVAGKPEFGFFGSIKVEGKEQYTVRAFRCVKCGYMENYAL